MSDHSLDQLIATLKSEAIEAAEQSSEKILEAARTKADQIIEAAKRKRSDMLKSAEKEAKDIEQKGKSALQQAARDLHVSLRNDLLKLLQSALTQEVGKTFSPDVLPKAVSQVIENVGSGVDLRLSDTMEEDLAKAIQQELRARSEVNSIISDESILSGMAITKTAEGWSFELSPEEVAQLLSHHLTSRWVKILEG